VFPPFVLVINPTPPEIRGVSCPDRSGAQQDKIADSAPTINALEREPIDRCMLSNMCLPYRAEILRVSAERLLFVSGMSLKEEPCCWKAIVRMEMTLRVTLK
jgi:hypothetical protein